MFFLYLPFALQGLAMMFDEFYFHHRRGLARWEKVGHPLDTLTVLACYLFLFTQPYSATNMNIFIGLAVFSCLFITKDEWVHTEVCSAEENWLHAILFVLHPVCFLAASLVWKDQIDQSFLLIQSTIIFLFMIYQILYWSFNWKKIKA
ncbi:MAG: hypothetical protein H7328_06975 [Bdellovibrio sp.]|nr:hypothetical protein [Bdellovibrio sp.]